ncbi:MAG TPA: lipopolysaccharide biosynthesis protein RfbH [Burkholderiales bacterium]|nr:lipopolysaccharide biosynthesis protein RfbH [Burkholderiales bacterium]
MSLEKRRRKILDLVREFAAESLAPRTFRPGESQVPPAGKVLNAEDLASLVDASLDGWLTTGRFNDAFEQRLAKYLGVTAARTTNSGSSANLLALSALTSPLLGKRALKSGDEVVTAAAGFPTTVNPILQNGLVPVFIDSAVPGYNPTVQAIEAALSPRTRAIALAHTLGNPYAVEEIRALADRHGLWLVEDCCDALGSTYRGRKVGSFGHVGTLSFYPAHHITMGEGGAVFTSDPDILRALESFRDWGRDCWCAPGKENTCGKRFDWKLGDLPQGYDHKYIYSHAGYNLKITDMQAAVGLSQLARIDEFVAARKKNFAWLRRRLAPLADQLILPEATPGSDPSWFGFPVTLAESVDFARVDLLKYLDQQRVGTRLLFAGNLTRQPYLAGRDFRVSGSLETADRITRDSFWIGVWPGLGEAELEYAARSIETYFGQGF